MSDDPYKIAYERERNARLQAEKLLEDKTRALFDKVIELENTLEQMNLLQTQLVQAEKMATIGQLSAGVAHEINNPVGFCFSNINSLKEYLEPIFELDDWVTSNLQQQPELLAAYHAKTDDIELGFIKDDSVALIDDTLNGLVRVKEIVAKMKKVSHFGDGELELCSVNTCIDDALKMVWNELKYTMQVNTNLSDIPQVMAQNSELQQILINMFINAVHACGNQGVLNICTHLIYCHAKPYVEICICDNGSGIDETVIKHIFDPFFTTKPVGQGTGLGLAISQGIINKYKGKLAVASKLGEGTNFTIQFPVTDDVMTDFTTQPAFSCKLNCKLQPQKLS